jgi:dTMP kinase
MQSSEKDIYHKVEDINQLVSDSHNLIDITLLLDIDPKIGLERISTNNRDTNSYDERSIDFHQSIREGYLKLAKKYPNRIKIIDANQSQNCILKESLNHLIDL